MATETKKINSIDDLVIHVLQQNLYKEIYYWDGSDEKICTNYFKKYQYNPLCRIVLEYKLRIEIGNKRYLFNTLVNVKQISTDNFCWTPQTLHLKE